MPLEYPREMFSRLITDGTLRMPANSVDGLARLVDTLFFASLMIEEGDPVQVAIVHHPEGAAGLETVTDDSPPEGDEEPERAWDVTAIPEQPFDAPTLAKISRGIEYGAQLVVVGGGETLKINGIARRRRRTDGGSATRIAAPRPGVLVFERHDQQLLRYEAGERGRQSFNVVGDTGPVRHAVAAINGEKVFAWSDNRPGTFYSYSELALHRLVERMRATESGAILAMLPQEPSRELRDIVRYGRIDPHALTKRIEADRERSMDWINSLFRTHDKNLTPDQVREREAAQHARDAAREELETAIEDVARLSAIDGAVLCGPKLAVYGAGCVLPSKPLAPECVRRALDIEGVQTEQYPNRHGARHRAAFSFAFENPGSVAFVASEDGPVSCAHRIEDNVLVWSVEVLET